MADFVRVEAPKVDQTINHADPEHDAKMIAVAEGRKYEPPKADTKPDEKPADQKPAEKPAENTDAQKPRLFAGKYKSIEEMEKGYDELRKALARPKDDPIRKAAEEQIKKEDEGGERKAAEQLEGADKKNDPPADSPLSKESREKYAKEFIEKGELSKESLESLTKANIPEDVIKDYLSLLKQVGELTNQVTTQKGTLDTQAAAKLEQDIFTMVGGEDQYRAIDAWATVNLPQEDLAAFNAVLETGDAKQITLAVTGLKSLYTEANGERPKLITGDSTTSQGQEFKSREQIVAAMKDPRYSRDPAYRAEVAERLKNSKII